MLPKGNTLVKNNPFCKTITRGCPPSIKWYLTHLQVTSILARDAAVTTTVSTPLHLALDQGKSEPPIAGMTDNTP